MEVGKITSFMPNNTVSSTQESRSGFKDVLASKKTEMGKKNTVSEEKKPVAKKEVVKKTNTQVKSDKTSDKLSTKDQEALEKLKEDLEEVAEKLGVEPSEVFEAIVAFLQSSDMSKLTEMVAASKSLEDVMSIVTDAEAFDLLKELQAISGMTEDLLSETLNIDDVLSALDLDMGTFKEELHALMQEHIQSDEELLTNENSVGEEQGLEEQMTVPTVEVNTGSQEQSTGEEHANERDTSVQLTGSDNTLQSQGNMFTNHMMNMERIQDEIATRNENANVSQLLKQDIVQQVVERITIEATGKQTDMMIQLKPEHLGRLELNLVSNDGVVTAKFMAESHVAKEAIESQILQLKETLEQQNINVDEIEVSVANNSYFEQREQNHEQQQSNKNSKAGRVSSLMQSDVEEEDEVVDAPLLDGEHQVDFSA